jgi:hypothetical protein
MNRRSFIPAAIAAVVAAPTVLPAMLGAQTWRTFDVSRPAHDAQSLAVHVTYGAGRVRVQPATNRRLFDIHFRYDAERTEPTYAYDAATNKLDLGVRQTSLARNMRGGEGSELKLQLATTTPMRLALDVGAAEGDYDLSGLRLEELSMQTGATDTRMRFDAPNPVRMHSMRLQIGAAAVQITGLGNANAERIDVNLGVGQATLEFGGEWRGDADMSVNSALGEVILRVPADVGIRVESSTFLHSFDAPGMIKKGGYSVSANWDTAKYKLRLHSSGALGRLEIQRIAR